MKKILLALSVLVAGVAQAQSSIPIYKATPTGHVCLDGRNCSPLVDANGRLLVTSDPNSSTNPDTASVSGTIDMTSTASVFPATSGTSCDGKAGWVITVTRTAETGGLGAQVSNDGTNWSNTYQYQFSNNVGGPVNETSTSAQNVYNVSFGTAQLFGSCAGHKFVRAKVAVAGAGAALPINIRTSFISNAITVAGVFPGINATNLGKTEDLAAATGDVGVAALFQTQDPLTSDQNANNDYALPKVDRTGRLITSPYAPHGESWQACGTATAVVTDVVIKAAVASNRIYVTTFDCKNTSTTVGPTLDFKDGATIFAVSGITATSATGATPGSVFIPFGVPLRGTVNTALNFATNTATTSVTCCAAGFVSVD